MPSMDSSNATKPLQNSSSAAAPPPPPEQEHLPCPRCDSTNTKFCYYNNYNYSQPRHFCKACRRYWTHGGTLRDIPVGGGSRKNAKRSRTTHHHASASATSSSSSSTMTSASPLMVHNQGGSGSMQFLDGDHVKQNANVSACGGGSFTSLLNNTTHQGSAATSGFLALGGFGHHGFEDMGFGIGRVGWTFPGGMVEGANIGGGGGVAASGGGGPWQLEGGEGGFVSGDCFSWPGLAISTPGYGLK